MIKHPKLQPLQSPLSKKMYTFFMLLLLLCSPLLSNHAEAQRAHKVKAYAQDSATLVTREGLIQLWGLDAKALNNSVSGLKARFMIDELIGDAEIECTAIKKETNRVIARCINNNNKDIALELVKAGFGVLDRAALAGQEAYNVYSEAQRRARYADSGVWQSASQIANHKNENQENATPDGQQGLQAKDILLITGVFLGPILGMLIVGAIIYIGLDRMTKLQRRQIAMSQQREKELRDREKFVLAASLESEINTNRAKIDAFLLIYEDMLRNLKDPSKSPKYQQSGDIVHQRPALSRAVYDANLDRMDLVGPQIFAELSEIYVKIDPNPDYLTLEPEMPIEQVVDKVQKIIQNSNELINPLDKANTALSMIIRERKKKMPQPSTGSL